MLSSHPVLTKLRKCLYLYIGATQRNGLGLFTARNLARDALVIVDEDGDYYNQVLTYAELTAQNYDLHDDAVQIGHDAFVLPNGNLDDFMNHSCDPNCGIRLTPEGYVAIALRDIQKDEELTYDYSTYMGFSHPCLPCTCGATACRGVIDNFSTLAEPIREKYLSLGVVGEFVARDPISHRG